MKTLETDAEIMADGSLKLLSPLPAWIMPGRAHVLLTVEAIQSEKKPKRKKLTANPEMIARRIAAIKQLRAMGGLREVISDPVAWQRKNREDRPLPGRS